MAAATIPLTTIENTCDEMLEQLHLELERLFVQKYLGHDLRFLRKIAITIKHLHFDAKNVNDGKVCHFLTSPLGSFMENELSLLEAADLFSEQDPKYSDLGELLAEMAAFGPLFIRAPRALTDS